MSDQDLNKAVREKSSEEKMQEIQKAYNVACSEFGHLTLRKRTIDARLVELEAHIAKLDAEAGKIKAANQNLTKKESVS